MPYTSMTKHDLQKLRLNPIEDELPASLQFPYCVVWTPIPLISWLLPFVGHMGICTSKGITLDFAGPYFISVDNLAFGNPARQALSRTCILSLFCCSRLREGPLAIALLFAQCTLQEYI